MGNSNYFQIISDIVGRAERAIFSKFLLPHTVSNYQKNLQHGKPLKGSRVLVLGTAYKPDVDDLRESPALDVIGLLEQNGAVVDYHDPYIPQITQDSWEKTSVSYYLLSARQSDCLVIVTDHSCYDFPAILEAVNLIVDTRNALSRVSADRSKVVRL